MMAGVGDSEIGGHTQSTLLYKVVPELSFKSCCRVLIQLEFQELFQSSHSRWKIFAALRLFGNESLAGFLDKLKLGNESRVEFIKLLSEASPNMLP